MEWKRWTTESCQGQETKRRAGAIIGKIILVVPSGIQGAKEKAVFCGHF